jgi:hypothetical protein
MYAYILCQHFAIDISADPQGNLPTVPVRGNVGINLHIIATSEIRVSCVVDRDQGVNALQVVHQASDLGGEQTVTVPGS